MLDLHTVFVVSAVAQLALVAALWSAHRPRDTIAGSLEWRWAMTSLALSTVLLALFAPAFEVAARLFALGGVLLVLSGALRWGRRSPFSWRAAAGYLVVCAIGIGVLGRETVGGAPARTLVSAGLTVPPLVATAYALARGSARRLQGGRLIIGAAALGVLVQVLRVGALMARPDTARRLEALPELLDLITLMALGLGFVFVVFESRESHLEDRVAIDPLTGLFNRRSFYKVATPVFAQADRSKRPISLVAANIDRLERINTERGRSAGDQLLAAFAEVASRTLRGQDLVARYDDEIFVVVLPDTEIGDAGNIAERLRSAFRMHVVANQLLPRSDGTGESDAASISMGIAERTDRRVELDYVLKLALEALQQAKLRGRNQVVAAPKTVSSRPPAPAKPPEASS